MERREGRRKGRTARCSESNERFRLIYKRKRNNKNGPRVKEQKGNEGKKGKEKKNKNSIKQTEFVN